MFFSQTDSILEVYTYVQCSNLHAIISCSGWLSGFFFGKIATYIAIGNALASHKTFLEEYSYFHTLAFNE